MTQGPFYMLVRDGFNVNEPRRITELCAEICWVVWHPRKLRILYIQNTRCRPGVNVIFTIKHVIHVIEQIIYFLFLDATTASL